MSKVWFIVVGLLPALLARTCCGHGNPIHVDVVAGQLTVSGGAVLHNGYVTLAFDDHEDAFLDTAPGNNLGVTLPGFDVQGMEVNSHLYLEILSRPDFTLAAQPQRWLWHWSDATGKVGVAAHDPVLRLASQRLLGNVLLTQLAAPTSGPSMLVMEPRDTDIATHQHPIRYLLDNDPAAPTGAYGFFLRLTSPNYAPSAPFLVALNHTDPANFITAAMHINAAARLPGDFDGDDDVDGSDLMLWQQTAGTMGFGAADATLDGQIDGADLAIWRAGFGGVYAPTMAAGVPEPIPARLAAIATLLSLGCPPAQRRPRAPRRSRDCNG